MKGKILLEKMELIDPELIEAADKQPDIRSVKIMKRLAAALAACIVLTLFSGIMMLSSGGGFVHPEVSSPDSASVFGGGTVYTVIFGASLLLTAGISGVMIHRSRKK